MSYRNHFHLALVTAMTLILAMNVVGCATSAIKVTSAPEGADVTVVAKDRAPVKVGKTPLDLDERILPELFRDSMQIQVSREGHSPVSVLVPRLPMGALGRINVNLEETVLPKICQTQGDSLNTLAQGLVDSASLIQRKRLDDATRILEDLSSKYATVPVVFDLLGNVYFLQRNLDRSLEAYRKSNKLMPGNSTTSRMIERIQQLQGRSSGGA